MALAGRNRTRGEVGGGGEEVRGRRGGIRLGAMRSRCVWSLLCLDLAGGLQGAYLR